MRYSGQEFSIVFLTLKIVHRMKTVFFCTAMLAALSLNGQSSIHETLRNPGFQDRVDSLVKAYMDLDLFSGVVLVADRGEPVYHKAFGYANREQKVFNTLNTKFLIGSMNKTFTEVVILQLISEGKLKYSDRLTSLLPGFLQQHADQITVQHLIDHTSGFGDYHGPAYWELPNAKKSIAGITDILRGMPLHFPPGEEEMYSNAGYILLGAIIEKVTGKSYAQAVRERIAVPLGLNDTYLENNAAVPDKTIGYSQTIMGLEDNSALIHEPLSDGGFWSTATDVMTFYRNYFYDNQMLSPADKEASTFFQQIAPFYDQPGRGIPLAGGMNGLNTMHLEMLHEGISIVVLANMDEPVAEKVGMGIFRILKGQQPDPATLPAVLNVYNAFQQHGVAYIKTHFDALTRNFHPTDPRDLILNNLGYALLFNGNADDAVLIFKLNTELFPDVANCWDSYGEGLLAQGKKALALEAYRKALAIDPGMPTAREAVEKLSKD